MSDPSPVQLEAGGLRWWVKPGYEAFVRDVLAPGCRAPETLPGARTIKQNRVRTVARVPDSPEGPLFCKRFRVLKRSRRLLHVVKLSPAHREWDVLRQLREAGVDCPEPVVLGEERPGLLVGSVLATREVAGAQEVVELVDELRAAGDTERRQRLATGLARIVHQLLQAGLDHADLHLGNFLARDDDSLVALDMHSASVRPRPLGATAALKRLGKVAHGIGVANPTVPAGSLEELRWFAEAYAPLDPRHGDADALEAALLTGARRVEAIRLASRDKRCVKTSTQYAVEGTPARRVYRLQTVSAEALETALAADADEVLHRHRKGRSLLEAVATPAGFGDDVGPRLLRKTYLFPKSRHRITGSYAPRALRAWKATRACQLREVPVPAAYALVSEGWPLPSRAVLLMELLPGDHLERTLRDRPPAPSARHRLAEAYGRLIGRFHAAGLTHRDLAPQNVMVRHRDDGGWDLWLLDLDDVSVRPMTRDEKLRALTHLADTYSATRADRARFWRSYLDAGGDEVFAPELEAWGVKGLAERVRVRVEKRAAERRARRAKQPEYQGRDPDGAPAPLQPKEST